MSERAPKLPRPESESEGDEGMESYFSKELIEQFGNPETLELYGGKLSVVDVRPEQEKIDVPVFVAPGWAANAQVFKENILGTASKGRRTLSVNNFHGLKAEQIDDYPNAELRKVAGLISTLDEKGIEKTDVIAHSEGGLYTTIAARIHPERFRNLVLVAPAGMIGKDNIARLGVGFSHDIVRQTVAGVVNGEVRRPMLRAYTESGKSMTGGPLQSVKEVFAIAGAEIPDWLQELRQKGVGVSIIHGVDDKAFPMERVQKVAKSDQKTEDGSLSERGNVDGFYSVKGGHNDIYLKPEQFTVLAEQALSVLEN